MAVPARSRRLFIFDLDGTLIDSKADIARAMNLALARMDLEPLPVSRVADFVGEGLQKLVERALQEITDRFPESAEVQKGILLFKQEYEEHLLDHTRLYPGIREALARLSGALFAVVSNKPEKFCRQILDGLGVGPAFRTILGGDSVPTRKPDPGGLLTVMQSCGASPSESVMVGDSPVDIAAGKAAGTLTCGVTWGFRPRAELESAGCDLILDNPLDLAERFQPD
jgi:phosphoglycolate phosphatase